MNDLEIQKIELIKKLKKKGISDLAVLHAIKKVRREDFIPDLFKSKSYEDHALPISENQTISQPYTVAFMSSLLDIHPGDKVLEIGTGSGYQAAILCEMGAKVFTVERINKLAEQALKNINKSSYTVSSKVDDGTSGWVEEAPFDGIIVTAASPKVSDNLKNQLEIGGRLVIPVGSKKSQYMIRITRLAIDKYREENFGSFKFVPLIGKEGFDD